MIIRDIQYKRIAIRLKGVFRVAFTDINHVENVLVKIETEEGIIGFGEAAPLPFVTGETADSVEAMLRLLRPGLIGMNALAVDAIHAAMDGAAAGNSSAKCAVDLALHDIIAKSIKKPVYQLLGGKEARVQNDATIGLDEPEAMAQTASYFVNDLGYHILKIKVGRNPNEDLAAISCIRKAVGAHVRLRVDANQGYTVSTATGLLEPFRELGVEAIEQCLPAWDFEGAAYVRSKARGIALMLDESIHGPRDALRAVQLGAADSFNIKLMKCGGLYPAKQIAAIAQAGGQNCMVGCMLETPLALTAGLSLVASRQMITEADCDAFMYYDPAQTGVTGGFTVENGALVLSDAPGFGVNVDF